MFTFALHECKQQGMKHIAEELKAFMEITGMPALRLSEASGVASPYISRLINGQCEDIYSRKADALREAMLSLDYQAARKVGVGV